VLVITALSGLVSGILVAFVQNWNERRERLRDLRTTAASGLSDCGAERDDPNQRDPLSRLGRLGLAAPSLQPTEPTERSLRRLDRIHRARRLTLRHQLAHRRSINRSNGCVRRSEEGDRDEAERPDKDHGAPERLCGSARSLHANQPIVSSSGLGGAVRGAERLARRQPWRDSFSRRRSLRAHCQGSCPLVPWAT
jgi:hypothetical protein